MLRTVSAVTPTSKPSIVALIPARAGSKRVPGKNFRKLDGQSLVHRAIRSADASHIFSRIILSSDIDHESTDWWMASVLTPFSRHDRNPEHATDDAPDIRWVKDVLELVDADAFAILRPTSPFRTAETIKRAWAQFQVRQPCDSLRAVEPVKQHPGKMWEVHGGGEMVPFIRGSNEYAVHWTNERLEFQPWHSCPTQTLPKVYVQNASLEIAWTSVVRKLGTISGNRIMPFFTEGLEGFDINTEDDWKEAERLMLRQPVEYLG